MKILRNIILIILFGALVVFGIYMWPNFKKSGNEGKRNLVINYTNVTSTMKGKVIIDDDKNVYISMADIENYYDRHIHYDKQYNYIIIAKGDKTACFDINKNQLDINGEKSRAKIIVQDGTYYVPISLLEDVYNIDVTYKEAVDTVIIESLDRKLEVAKAKKNVRVKYKAMALSRTLEKVQSGAKLAIVPNQTKKGWTLVRTENGKIGYVKSSDLGEVIVERKEEEKPEGKPISMVWEYFSEVSHAPRLTANDKYEGVNVVSPSFFYMESSNVKENVGEDGKNYINWAKSNGYMVWAMVSNNNISEEKMNEFSAWVNDYEKRKDVINQIVNYAKLYELDGINIDFENIYLKDKDSYSRFIIELKPQLKNIGVTLSVDVTEPDGSDNWSLCFNRNVIGNVADYIVFMAYDQYSQYSTTAGPTAACYWVERNIYKFINQEEVDASKIILGIPFYCVLWQENNGNVSGQSIAQKNIRIPENADITWMADSKQNYMEYYQNNKKYFMWIEDVEATSQKLDLVNQYGLAGAAYWQKGFEDPAVWQIIKEKIM